MFYKYSFFKFNPRVLERDEIIEMTGINAPLFKVSKNCWETHYSSTYVFNINYTMFVIQK